MTIQETDPQLRALFTHLRQALDLLEEIAARPSLAPEAPPNNDRKPAAQQPALAPIFSESTIAYSIVEVMRLADVSRSKLYSEIGEGRLRAVKRGRRTFIRLHTTKTVGLPHAREHGELYDGVA